MTWSNPRAAATRETAKTLYSLNEYSVNMVGGSPFVDDPADTREAIMKATYLALSEYGYADLTIQRIGDEFGKSKSLLYHHYDGKDDLLLDFLEFMLERVEEFFPLEEHDGADAQLEAVLDHVLSTPADVEEADFFGAMIELRAQAAHDPAYRDHFTKSDQFFRGQISELVRSGVETGAFRDVDPEATAAFLQSVIVGVMFQRATSEGDPGPTARDEVDAYLQARLLPDPA